MRILARDLARHLNQRVTLRGWLNNVRSFGKLTFLIVRDRTGFIQVVIEKSDSVRLIEGLHAGSILEITGKVVAATQTQQGLEIVDPEITVDVAIKEPPPLEYYKPKIQAELDFILDHRPIALRNRELQAIFKIQAELTHAYRLFMHDEMGAVEYFAPNIIGASSEGGAEFFNVDYFGYTATLAQSSQLYKQIMVGVNERVFALMPFFRAENSHTTRHLSEGKQFEFEMGFFDRWEEIMDVQERCIKYMVAYLQNQCAHELEVLGKPLISAPLDIPFPRLTFAEAQELFFKRTGIDERHEPDLSPHAERELCQYAHETHGTDLIFITDWKRSKRPFYAAVKEENPALTNTFDLLCAGTEITSGGQRRHTYVAMVEGICEKGMDPANFEDYLSIFKYGMPVHGGFGMGLERLTMTLLRLKNIREASLFPSDPKRIAANRIKAKIFFGGENIRNEIVHLLRTHDFEFDHRIHEPTLTSEAAAKVRGIPLEWGIKALIVRGKRTKKNYQVNIAAHGRADMKAIADAVGEKCDFEEPEVIKERFGLEVGSIPPFGPLFNVECYFDQGILNSERCAFNCGLVTESIIMKTSDLIELVKPKLGTFIKEQ